MVTLDSLIDRVKGNVLTEEDIEDVKAPDDASALLDSPADDILPSDPKPGKKTRPRRVPPTPGKKATVAEKKQVEENLNLFLTLTGAISLRDPVCGGAIQQQKDAIVEAATKIICRNPAMLAWFVGSTGFMDFLALGAALAPVVTTVYKHHVSHSIGVEGGHVDHATAYSAYSAPSI